VGYDDHEYDEAVAVGLGKNVPFAIVTEVVGLHLGSSDNRARVVDLDRRGVHVRRKEVLRVREAHTLQWFPFARLLASAKNLPRWFRTRTAKMLRAS